MRRRCTRAGGGNLSGTRLTGAVGSSTSYDIPTRLGVISAVRPSADAATHTCLTPPRRKMSDNSCCGCTSSCPAHSHLCSFSSSSITASCLPCTSHSPTQCAAINSSDFTASGAGAFHLQNSFKTIRYELAKRNVTGGIVRLALPLLLLLLKIPKKICFVSKKLNVKINYTIRLFNYNALTIYGLFFILEVYRSIHVIIKKRILDSIFAHSFTIFRLDSAYWSDRTVKICST